MVLTSDSVRVGFGGIKAESKLSDNCRWLNSCMAENGTGKILTQRRRGVGMRGAGQLYLSGFAREVYVCRPIVAVPSFHRNDISFGMRR